MDFFGKAEEPLINFLLDTELSKELQSINNSHDGELLNEYALKTIYSKTDTKELSSISHNDDHKIDLINKKPSTVADVLKTSVQMAVPVVDNSISFWVRKELEYRCAIIYEYFYTRNSIKFEDASSVFFMQKLYNENNFLNNNEFTRKIIQGDIKSKNLERVDDRISKIFQSIQSQELLLMMDLELVSEEDHETTMIVNLDPNNELVIINGKGYTREEVLLRLSKMDRLLIFRYKDQSNMMSEFPSDSLIYDPKTVFPPKRSINMYSDFYKINTYKWRNAIGQVSTKDLLLLKDQPIENITINPTVDWIEEYTTERAPRFKNLLVKKIYTGLRYRKDSSDNNMLFWSRLTFSDSEPKNSLYYAKTKYASKLVSYDQLETIHDTEQSTVVVPRYDNYVKLLHRLLTIVVKEFIPFVVLDIRESVVNYLLDTLKIREKYNMNYILQILVNMQIDNHNFITIENLVKGKYLKKFFTYRKYDTGDANSVNTLFIVRMTNVLRDPKSKFLLRIFVQRFENVWKEYRFHGINEEVSDTLNLLTEKEVNFIVDNVTSEIFQYTWKIKESNT